MPPQMRSDASNATRLPGAAADARPPASAEPPSPDPLPPAPARATSFARTSLSSIMTVVESNLLGGVHGGVIMKLVDSVAGAVAQRHSGGVAVTAAMDEMVFLEPVQVGDLVHAAAQVNWTGRTSMEIGVRVLAERWNEAGPTKRVATAYLVFVALDERGGPRDVPPVLPETEEDRRRYAEGEIRRRSRLARREEILRSRSGAAPS